MPSTKLVEAFTIATRLREICQATSSMSAYQQLATLAVKICVSATPNARKNVSSLAVHAVKRTDVLIKNVASIILSAERKQDLDKFESILDLIRQHIETIPEQGTKSPKFGFSALKFARESTHLKSELDRAYKSLTSEMPSSGRNEFALEMATIGTRAAGVICDIPIPGLNFAKPAIWIVALICETARTVNGNRDAALALARHAQDVTNFVVKRAHELHGEEMQILWQYNIYAVHSTKSRPS